MSHQSIPILTPENLLKNLKNNQNPFFTDYFAFYSSWLGGITKDPYLMLVPMDDRIVTRGDGVFETMKAVNRSVYLLDEHLDRFFNSAKQIGLVPCFDQEKIKNIILETLRVAGEATETHPIPETNFMIRAFLSRGPGNFTANPYEPVGSQFYLVITRFNWVPKEKYEQGVKIGRSDIATKPSWLAKIKSCNYLPNVMMRKEAIDKKLDYVIGLDSNNFLTEGSTENLILINQLGELVYPALDFILKGTMMTRLFELAEVQGMKIKSENISLENLKSAQEVFMIGTSFDLLPVIKFEQDLIGGGRPGDYFKKFKSWLEKDMTDGPKRTEF